MMEAAIADAVIQFLYQMSVPALSVVVVLLGLRVVEHVSL
jgi:hypothetical protein